MLRDGLEPYRRKKARKSLEIQAFLVFFGSGETLIWWRRGDLNLRYNYMFYIDIIKCKAVRYYYRYY